MIEIFDIASRRLPGAFFVRSAPVGTFLSDRLDGALRRSRPDMVGASLDTTERLVWTRGGESSTLKEALLAMIRSARRKIFIASFRIGDEELFKELFAAVNRLHGSVYVITLVDDKSLARGIAEADDETGADEQALHKQFGPLVEQGLYVRGHDSCHAKFVVVDDEIALVSSANLETRAFTTTTEIGAVIHDRGEVGRLGRLFAVLWHECTWEVAPSTSYTMAKRATTAAPVRAIPGAATPQHAIWTHGAAHDILRAIRETIRSAERDLLLASYSLTGMASSRDLLLSEVERFKRQKGGAVRLLVRARNNVPSQRRDAEAFAAIGCDVLADDVNHAKCVIGDDSEAVLFSANFDAQHGLTSGVEAGIRLVEPRLVRGARAFFEGLILSAPVSLVVAPSHATLQRLAARWAREWPEASSVHIYTSDDDWQALVSLEAGRPVLFEEGTDGRLVLIAGRAAFFLQRPARGAPARLERATTAGVDSSATFEEWLSARAPSPAARGLCAATFIRATDPAAPVPGHTGGS